MTMFFIAGLIIVIVVFVVVFSKKKSAKISQVEILGMADLISFFKKPENFELLQEDKNIIAVAIKDIEKNDNNVIAACLFDKERNEVKKTICTWNYKNLDEDLRNAFGEKTMIVLT